MTSSLAIASVPAPIDYPSVADARLPATYEAAKTALATCEQIDECAEWANKMEALASYARQSENDELLKHCLRIKARAIRRAGELLNEIEPGQGARDGKREADTPLPFNRTEAASSAGLSPHQAKQAVRVANVPRQEFERQVESSEPPTVTKLAEQGKATRPAPIDILKGRDPEDFKTATAGLARTRDFAGFVLGADFPAIIRGSSAAELTELTMNVATIEYRLACLRQYLAAEEGQ